MGQQSAARLQGDRYQHLYSWFLILRLLDESSEYEHAYVEHPKGGATDDVTLHPKSGKTAPTRYHQVKWHVTAGGHYTYDLFTKVSPKEKTSLIQKLFKSWKDLSGDGSVEIWLVSNWSAINDFGRFIRDSSLSDEFFACGTGSKKGKGRASLLLATGATEDEFNAFCRSLRFRLGFAGIGDLEEMVDDRMALHGLKTGSGPRAIAIDQVKLLIERGGSGKKITRETLIDLIRSNDLIAPQPDQPKVSLYVHGWAKRAFDVPPTVELDWTGFFDRDTRMIPSQVTWDNTLFPQLNEVRRKFQTMESGNYVDFRGKLPLSASIAIGYIFPEVAGISFRLEQPTAGENSFWKSNTPPTKLCFRSTTLHDNHEGHDILLAFSITGDGRNEIEEFYRSSGNLFSALVILEPETGAGQTSLAGAGDVVALANAAKEAIREYKAQYKSKTVHIIPYAPAGFCFFLGQKLNALGQIVTYERTLGGEYQRSVTLSTG